jgi:hypothetical protein
MKLSKYRFVIKPQQQLILSPYKGSALRGVFGLGLRNLLCPDIRRKCNECMAQNMCIYSYVFETSILSEIRGQKKKIEVPRPFIIEPPLDQINYYGMDDRLVFHFILIGRAVDYIKICIKAFQERGDMGIGINNGKYFLENVTSINKDIERIIFDGNSYIDDCEIMESSELLNEGTKLNSNRVTLRFLTRVRIKYKGNPVTDLDFEIFMVTLLGRLESIARVHCDEKWDFDKIGLIKRSNDIRTIHNNLKWKELKRRSNRQNIEMEKGGLLGDITFEGELAEFMPFIKLGEFLHIGGGTAYGLGKYEIMGEEE